jgi:phage-related protein
MQFRAYFGLMKKLIWMGSSREDLRAFPREARREMGYQLEHVQEGVDPGDGKPMSAVGSGVREIRVRESSGAFRCMYLATRLEGIYVLHCFQKKTRKTSQQDLDLAGKRFKAIQVKS